MLDALNKTVVVELKEHFNLSDVYFVLHDSEEYLNIAQRKTQFDLDTKELKVPDQPIGFVKMVGFSYDERRNGYRAKSVGYSWVDEDQRYIGFSAFTVRVEYDVVVYGVFGAQMMDMVGWFLHFDRRTSVVVVLGGSYSTTLPVSLLVEEVGAPVVDFTLRDRGLKLYRLQGRVVVLTYEIPVGVRSQGSGVYQKLTPATVQYQPLKEIRLKFRVGGNVYSEDGQLLESEIFPCLLRV